MALSLHNRICVALLGNGSDVIIGLKLLGRDDWHQAMAEQDSACRAQETEEEHVVGCQTMASKTLPVTLGKLKRSVSSD